MDSISVIYVLDMDLAVLLYKCPHWLVSVRSGGIQILLSVELHQ